MQRASAELLITDGGMTLALLSDDTDDDLEVCPRDLEPLILCDSSEELVALSQ